MPRNERRVKVRARRRDPFVEPDPVEVEPEAMLDDEGSKSARRGLTGGSSASKSLGERSVGELDSMVLLHLLCLGGISMETGMSALTGGWDRGDGFRSMTNEWRLLSRGTSSVSSAGSEEEGMGSVYSQEGSPGCKRN